MLDGIFLDGFSWMLFLSVFFWMVCLPPLDGFFLPPLDGFLDPTELPMFRLLFWRSRLTYDCSSTEFASYYMSSSENKKRGGWYSYTSYIPWFFPEGDVKTHLLNQVTHHRKNKNKNHQSTTSWWFQPISKNMLVKMDHFPNFRGWKFQKYLGVSKNNGKPQIIPLKNRVFHYFHHPFWGVKSPYFWFNTHLSCHQPDKSQVSVFHSHKADLRCWPAALASKWRISMCTALPCLLHPRKLTWNLKMMVSNRKLLFQVSIFGCHASFRGCIFKMFPIF